MQRVWKRVRLGLIMREIVISIQVTDNADSHKIAKEVIDNLYYLFPMTTGPIISPVKVNYIEPDITADKK